MFPGNGRAFRCQRVAFLPAGDGNFLFFLAIDGTPSGLLHDAAFYGNTPATRASIIETLFKRGYMERCKKSLVPTEKGLALNSVVKTMRIADVAMTGESSP